MDYVNSEEPTEKIEENIKVYAKNKRNTQGAQGGNWKVAWQKNERRYPLWLVSKG